MVAENKPKIGLGFIFVNIYNICFICYIKDYSKYLSHSSNIMYFTYDNIVSGLGRLLNVFRNDWGVVIIMFIPKGLLLEINYFY
jgi:hypothetical protein